MSGYIECLLISLWCAMISVDIYIIVAKKVIAYLKKKGLLKKVKCQDIKCGSYSECDKIHCHQFYEYTEDGIIKREEKI